MSPGLMFSGIFIDIQINYAPGRLRSYEGEDRSFKSVEAYQHDIDFIILIGNSFFGDHINEFEGLW